MKEEKNPIEQILDENNTENITLMDANNKPIEFEQIALIPLENSDKIYAFLLPVTPIPGVGEDEGVLFEVDEQNGTIQVETDEKIIDEAMKVYTKLFDDQNK